VPDTPVFDEPPLGPERHSTFSGPDPGILTITMQFPGFDCIGEMGREDRGEDGIPDPVILHREEDLDTAVQVPGPEIR
jgi:hypothetical protein